METVLRKLTVAAYQCWDYARSFLRRPGSQLESAQHESNLKQMTKMETIFESDYHNYIKTGSIPALPIVACWSVLEQDTKPQLLPGCFTAAHCSLITKDGSNAEKGVPTVGSIKCTLLLLTNKTNGSIMAHLLVWTWCFLVWESTCNTYPLGLQKTSHSG